MIYEFKATQSYNGYDKPWAGGTNINIYSDAEDFQNVGYWLSNSGTLTSGIYGTVSELIEIEEVTSYTIKNYGTRPYSAVICTYNENEEFIRRTQVLSNLLPYTWTPDLTCKYFRIAVSTPNYDTNPTAPMTISILQSCKMLLCLTDLVPDSYSPYANVCMPEGFNIWDPYEAEYFQVYAGFVNSNTRELYLRPVYQEYAGEELVGPWMSSLDPYAEDTTPTEGAFVIDFGGELSSFEITPFMLQTLLDSLGIRQHFTDGAGLLNSLMDQAQGRVRSEEELLHLSRPLNVIAIGDQLPAGLTFKPISKDVLPGLPGKFIR